MQRKLMPYVAGYGPGSRLARFTGPTRTLILSGWLQARPMGQFQRLGRNFAICLKL